MRQRRTKTSGSARLSQGILSASAFASKGLPNSSQPQAEFRQCFSGYSSCRTEQNLVVADLVPTAPSRGIAAKSMGFDPVTELAPPNAHRFSMRLQCECTAIHGEQERVRPQ